MLSKEAIEAYILQVMLGVVSSGRDTAQGVAFASDEGIIVLQRGGQHFRIRIEPITLEPPL